MQAISEYCSVLVQRIEEKYTLSPRVREAFLVVPRHAFVSSPDGALTEQWLREVYEDRALVTKRDERGMPLSSSSQPSVMALMLEALEVLPGMRVLEIGTGTGYNAALLARLAGDPVLVTTIDIDPALTELARMWIENVVGEGATIVSGNGFGGYLPNAPYERIIATASAFPVPPAWISQLAPGGRLVLDLRGKIGGGLMVVVKQADGSAIGRFLVVKETISFMGLRDSAEGGTRAEVFEIPSLEEQTVYEPGTVEHACAQHFCSYEHFRGADDVLNLWVQCRFPSLSIKWMQREKRAFVLLVERKSRTTLVVERRGEQIGVAVKGERALWSEVVRSYEEWLALGKPGLESYTLVIVSGGQEMRVTDMERSSTLAIVN